MVVTPKRKRWKVTIETTGGIQYFRIADLTHVKDMYQVNLEDNRQSRGLHPISQWILDVVMRDVIEDLSLKSANDIESITMVKVEV